ncbi:MAG: HAMP domain-containing histidine kinase [Ruminococcaceae bacterium]|nr:HAMP domain-containing histidine kinase [Oscillospiraceae bacterium]
MIVVLMLLAILGALGITSFYYSSALSTLEAKATAGADYFNTYGMSNYNEYYRSATLYAATFDSADSIELQFINRYGRIEASTRGLMSGTEPRTTEIAQAMLSGKMSSFNGEAPQTGEKILAVSCPLTFNGTVVGVMRYVTATRNLDRQILLTALSILGVMLVMCGLLAISSLIFINNVVAPVAEVTEAAKRIAGGSYGIQIPNHYSDEMGELVDNVNHMSLKISQSEKMQTEFISSVSHELRTPLTAINGWGETLEEEQDPEQLRRGMGIITKEARRLTNMVEELLEFSKMQDGRFTLRVEDMDLQAELEDAIYTYRQLFRQDGIDLTYDDGGEMYENPIIGDPERIKQVLCNLLDNAAKHGGSGKRIHVTMRRKEDDYVVQIRDFGPGIPEAELPFVKQKFYKGSSKARGSGIGLAVCDEILSRHGGALQIDNAEGGGTVVSVILPVKTEEN